jgi:hypothetical protein
VERLKHEIALLEMRSEQLRIHLRSIPSGDLEARRIRAVISTMSTKLRALKQFARIAGATGRRSKPTLHQQTLHIAGRFPSRRKQMPAALEHHRHHQHADGTILELRVFSAPLSCSHNGWHCCSEPHCTNQIYLFSGTHAVEVRSYLRPSAAFRASFVVSRVR